MIDGIIENLQLLGPVFVISWAVTVFCTVRRPQHYLNCVLLLFSLLVSMFFIAGFLKGDAQIFFLFACFILFALGLLLTPVLLISNGVQMIRRESVSLSHLLSLGLGIIVGIGEIATAMYVLHLSGFIDIGEIDYPVLMFAMTVFYFSSLVLGFVVYSLFIQIMPHRMNFNYVIIHGCGLAGGERMTKLLSNRVDRAIRIYERCREKPVIIPSGGQGEDEKLSEAQAMKSYLLGHGIPPEQIILEDRSTTTRENLIFSKEIIDSRPGKKKTALVSSNYHIYRCLLLARELGMKCTGIGADVAWYYWPSALIREFIAVFLSKRFLFWAVLGYLLFISPLIYAMI